MGDYITKKSDMKFRSMDALKTVQSVIDDADAVLKDKSRKIKDSPIGEAAAGAVGVGAVLVCRIIFWRYCYRIKCCRYNKVGWLLPAV